MEKISIRFFDNKPVRAVWDNNTSKWLFYAVDVIQAITESKNPKVYWSAIKKRHNQVFTICKQLKLPAGDGKKYLTDVIGEEGINQILMVIPSKKSYAFMEWIKGRGSTVDEASKQKAYEFFENDFFNQIEVGTTKGLQQIHNYIFSGLYDFAGQIRTCNIAKGGFAFAPAMYLKDNLKQIEQMPEDNIKNIVKKYVEMNIAHPFKEGNGRSTRIWLDLILKKNLKKCVDWSKIDKYEYLNAMKKSITDTTDIFNLINNSLTDKIHDREMFMKGIDYSYYYEEID